MTIPFAFRFDKTLLTAEVADRHGVTHIEGNPTRLTKPYSMACAEENDGAQSSALRSDFSLVTRRQTRATGGRSLCQGGAVRTQPDHSRREVYRWQSGRRLPGLLLPYHP